MAKRKSPRKGPFAGPNHSFPIGNKVHAREAISGATRSFNVGNISKSTEDSIKAKARKKLGHSAKQRTGKSRSWVG